MTKRLIDSAELIAKLPIVKKDKQISLIGAVADVVTMISECKPVEVVCCKDCKNYALWMNGSPMNYCDKHYCTAYDNDFCSYGERKGGQAPQKEDV